jgi:aminoglycoside N3'-acetyltransferase
MPTDASLEGQLAALGLSPGAVVMVHASMRRVGGDADRLIDAILSVVGPSGTMLMMVAEADGVPFDRLTTPADPENGVLAEVFRRRAGDGVSDHPASRFAAIGPQAAHLLSPVPIDDYYGPGSPLERFVAIGGQVLRLGADIDTITLAHHAEYLSDVPDKRRVRRRYLRADTGPVWIESLDDCDGIVDWPHGDYFAALAHDWLATDAVLTGPVGGAMAELFDAAAFVEYAIGWMEDRLN